MPVPRQTKNQIIQNDLILKRQKVQKIKKKIDFSIGKTVSLREIMSAQSTGRKKVNFDEG